MNIAQEKAQLSALLGGTVSPAQMSQSYLRIEAVAANQGQFSFNPNKTDGSISPTERKIANNDAFIVTHVALVLKKIASATPTNAQHAVAIDYNYVNKATNLFDSATDANLQAVYNGSLAVTIDNKIIIPALDTRCLQRVPTAQGGTTTAAITGPTAFTLGRDGYDNGLYGYYPLDNFVMTGGKKNDFTITLPASVDMATASETNYVCLLFKGYLVPNQG